MITDPRPEDSSSPIYKKDLLCPRCDWTGNDSQLLDGEACPRCRLIGLQRVPQDHSTKRGETPRVDAFLRAENCVRDNPVAFDWAIGLARQLERDRAELIEALGWLLADADVHNLTGSIVDRAAALLARLTKPGE